MRPSIVTRISLRFASIILALLLSSEAFAVCGSTFQWNSFPSNNSVRNSGTDMGDVRTGINYDFWGCSWCGTDADIWVSGGCRLNNNNSTTHVHSGGGCGDAFVSANVDMKAGNVSGGLSRCWIKLQGNSDGGTDSQTRVVRVTQVVTVSGSTASLYVGQTVGYSTTAKTSDGLGTTHGQGGDNNQSWSTNNSGICTVSGGTVTAQGAGTCTVYSTYSGGTHFGWAQGSRSFTVLAKVNQTITPSPAAPASIVVGNTFNVGATSTSGLDITITADGGCVLQSGGTNTAVIETTSTSAACNVYYNQAGNYKYNAAAQVSSSTSVTKESQAISWGTLPDVTYSPLGQFTINPLATADSGFIIDYSSSTASVCTLTGIENDVVVMQAAGTCTLNADQPGNANYNAAPTQTRSFTINKADQVITITQSAPANVQAGDSFNVAATATSGLPVSIGVSGNCSVTSGGSGSATIQATVNGVCNVNYTIGSSANYNAAPSEQEVVNVTKLLQTITVNSPSPANAFVGDTFNAVATSSSSLTVTITVSGGCQINSGGSGSAVIELTSGVTPCVTHYNQAGDSSYEPAPEKTNTTEAIRINQTIAIDTAPPASAVDGANFNVDVSASSGLDVWIVATGGCSLNAPDDTHPVYDPSTPYDGLLYNVNSASVNMNSATSSCTLTYLQYGDDDYYPADKVTSIVKDGTAPFIQEVAAVPLSTNDEPRYTLETDEAGTLVYGGSCYSSENSGISVGTDTIKFDKMAQGTYSDCTVAVRDAAGNVSNTLSLSSFTVVPPQRAYVKVGGAGDCSSWANACGSIQQAIDIAAVTEVWVAKGLYMPTTTLTLKEGLTIRGGFAGTESAVGQADPGANLTIISGDKDGDDVINSEQLVVFAADVVGTNLSRLMSADGLGLDEEDAISLHGLVLNAASGSSDGAGLYVSGSAVSMDQMRFVFNRGDEGGAIRVQDAGQVIVTRSTFEGNEATTAGGAISVAGDDANRIDVSQSLFDSNVGGNSGGAIDLLKGGLTVVNTTFHGNSLTNTGGDGGALNVGVLVHPGFAVIEYVTFHANMAGTVGSPNGTGGAINVDPSAGVTGIVSMANTLVVGNEAATASNISGMNNVTDDGYNIVGHNGVSGMTQGAGDSDYDFAGTSITASSISVGDIVNTELANNGGFTATLAVMPDSIARDRIPNLHASCSSAFAVGVDQRGGIYVRPGEDATGCDVGAFELENVDVCQDENRNDGVFIGFYPDANKACLSNNDLTNIGSINIWLLSLMGLAGIGRVIRRRC